MDGSTQTGYRLSKETHPDRGGDEGTFIQITQAYETLLILKS
jgi:curved DNA-binding protein CbpA